MFFPARLGGSAKALTHSATIVKAQDRSGHDFKVLKKQTKEQSTVLF